MGTTCSTSRSSASILPSDATAFASSGGSIPPAQSNSAKGVVELVPTLSTSAAALAAASVGLAIETGGHGSARSMGTGDPRPSASSIQLSTHSRADDLATSSASLTHGERSTAFTPPHRDAKPEAAGRPTTNNSRRQSAPIVAVPAEAHEQQSAPQLQPMPATATFASPSPRIVVAGGGTASMKTIDSLALTPSVAGSMISSHSRSTLLHQPQHHNAASGDQQQQQQGDTAAPHDNTSDNTNIMYPSLDTHRQKQADRDDLPLVRVSNINDRYLIDPQPLGKGSFGEVLMAWRRVPRNPNESQEEWDARCKEESEPVALKRVRPTPPQLKRAWQQAGKTKNAITAVRAAARMVGSSVRKAKDVGASTSVAAFMGAAQATAAAAAAGGGGAGAAAAAAATAALPAVAEERSSPIDTVIAAAAVVAGTATATTNAAPAAPAGLPRPSDPRASSSAAVVAAATKIAGKPSDALNVNASSAPAAHAQQAAAQTTNTTTNTNNINGAVTASMTVVVRDGAAVHAEAALMKRVRGCDHVVSILDHCVEEDRPLVNSGGTSKRILNNHSSSKRSIPNGSVLSLNNGNAGSGSLREINPPPSSQAAAGGAAGGASETQPPSSAAAQVEHEGRKTQSPPLPLPLHVRTGALTPDIQQQQQQQHANGSGSQQQYSRVLSPTAGSGCVYIAMEHCGGGDLMKFVLRCKNFSERVAAYLFRQMLIGVAHCHANGVVHRDLKPDNFLFASSEGRAHLKICDFGLAYHVKDAEQVMTDAVGSAFFIAPEVFTRQYTLACDAWSLGINLYLLLSGTVPFGSRATKATDVHKSIREDPLTFNGEVWKNVSASARELVSGLLEKNPYRRYTVDQALSHPWVSGDAAPDIPIDRSVVDSMVKWIAHNKLRREALKLVSSTLTAADLHRLREQFHLIDKDTDMCISAAELADALMSLGRPEGGPNILGMLTDPVGQHHPGSAAAATVAEQVKALFAAMDTNGDGVINLEEFLAATSELQMVAHHSNMWWGFCQYDKDGDGYIDVEEARLAIAGAGIELNIPRTGDEGATGEAADEEELAAVQRYIAEYDVDGDGRINYEEFIRMLMPPGHEFRTMVFGADADY